MSILAKLTDGKVELTDGWTNRVLCALDITSAALLATEIQAVAAVYKVRPPTPMPAPALGMRVWCTFQQGDVRKAASRDITSVRTGKVWADFDVSEDEITHIVDFRTGEALWRRS